MRDFTMLHLPNKFKLLKSPLNIAKFLKWFYCYIGGYIRGHIGSCLHTSLFLEYFASACQNALISLQR
jgi:hypothetical protein